MKHQWYLGYQMAATNVDGYFPISGIAGYRLDQLQVGPRFMTYVMAHQDR